MTAAKGTFARVKEEADAFLKELWGQRSTAAMPVLPLVYSEPKGGPDDDPCQFDAGLF